MITDRPLSLEDHVEAFAHQLVVALVNLEMHAPQSAHVQDNLRSIIAELGETWSRIAPNPVEITVTAEHICFRSRVLLRASLQAGRLLRLCRERGIEKLTFLPTLEQDELLRFLQLLDSAADLDVFTRQDTGAILRQRGIRNIAVGTARDARQAPRSDRDGDGGPHDPEPALRQYQAIADFLQSNHVNAFRGEGIELDAAQSVVERTVSHLDHEASGLLSLAMCDNIDNFTVGHSVRVTLLALQVADAAGASRQQLLRVGTAALLHDIGKSRIPQDILFKAGRLDDEERAIMSQHARLGGEVLLEQRGVDPTAIGAAFCHHMSPGGGYPEPVLPFEPSGVSKLVRVCDVFEALTAARPYKPPLAPLQAFVIMHRMHDGFDPAWLRFFVRSIGLFPLGSRIELDGGEEALVIANGPSLDRPHVRLLTTAAGEPRPADERIELTIGEELEGRPARIRAVTGGPSRVEIPPDLEPLTAPAGDCGCTVGHDAARPHA